jgi:pimeloyl-ACP methyl ester carboxylesterase
VRGREAGGRMNFVRRGSGAPLLLVHGLGSTWRNWGPILPMLTAQRDVIAVDLPGFGSSPALSGEVTIAELTDAVESFISEHDLGDVDVVGSSMGARMVMEMARRGHLGTVVALDPGGFWTDRQVKVFGATISASIWLVRRLQSLLPMLANSRVGRTALLLQFSAKPWRIPPALVLQELRSFAQAPSFDAALKALVRGPKQQGAQPGSTNGKVVVGWGRNDRVTPPSEAANAQQLFPDAILHWFGECGHFPHWDQPQQTADLILAATATPEARREG